MEPARPWGRRVSRVRPASRVSRPSARLVDLLAFDTMLQALTLILLCQLAGETTVLAGGLPVPGPVLGMLLLLGLLFLRGGVPEEVGRTADALLARFSLLFVPAGVGVMLHWERIRGEWLAIGTALVLGTLITLAVTGLTMVGVQRLQSGWRRAGWRRGRSARLPERRQERGQGSSDD